MKIPFPIYRNLGNFRPGEMFVQLKVKRINHFPQRVITKAKYLWSDYNARASHTRTRTCTQE